MQLHLQQKRALVTAASYGLGFACANALAAEGASVVLCSRDGDRAREAAATIRVTNAAEVTGLQADLMQEEDLVRLVQAAEKILGGIDILVLSTGHPPTFPLSQATDEHWAQGLDLLITPARKLAAALLPGMVARRYGRLIFIGSIFGLEPDASSIIQSTFRTGLNSLSKCIATEYANKGITSNVICPGYFDTPLLREVAQRYVTPDMDIDQVLESWKLFAPTETFGNPDDLGALAAFLASPRAAFLTGTSIAFDGGAVQSW